MHNKKRLPKISIIVPVYNVEQYLHKSLNSILIQTFTDFEIIIVNDGSTDNSGFICDEYAKKDHRVKVIHNQHWGASSARNTGVEAANGEFIGWVDSDDYIASNMYEILFSLAQEYKADIVECQFYMKTGKLTRRSGEDEPIVYGNGDFILHQFFNAKMKPGLVYKLYRREIWQNMRFPEGRIHQDFYMNMCFALKPLTYVRTSLPLYYYLVRENSITTTFSSREIRQAIHLYDFTMNLAVNEAPSVIAKKYLVKDAINRLMGRYFQVSVGSKLTEQLVYNDYLRKKLGFSLLKYIISADLPMKTRISYLLLIYNLKGLQIFLHTRFGKK